MPGPFPTSLERAFFVIPFKKAMGWVVISTLILSGIPWAIFGIYVYLWSLKMSDPQYEIVAIVQEPRDSDPIKTDFLAELLEISQDRRINLYKFDLTEAKQKLEKFPLIKQAVVKRIFPRILYVQYEIRKPFALLGDISNTAIDQEGYAFPFYPFFSPKKLPVLTLGLKGVVWGEKISEDKLALSKKVLRALKGSEVKIDTSSGDALSLGEQKIVVTIGSHFILLDPIDFLDGLRRYQTLLASKEFPIISGSAMIDLRLPKLAFVERRKDE